MSGLRARQKIARQNRILEAARSQLTVTDYQSITIEKIAQSAEVSPMTVFNYFGSKGGLLLSLVAESDLLLVEKIKHHLDSELSDPLSAITRFSHIIIDHAFSYLDRKTWGHVISTAILEGDSAFGQSYTALEQELIKLLSDLIQTLKEKHLIQINGDPLAIANIIYNVHNARFIEFASSGQLSPTDIKKQISEDFRYLASPMLDLRP